jgi:hypothetical protein
LGEYRADERDDVVVLPAWAVVWDVAHKADLAAPSSCPFSRPAD